MRKLMREVEVGEYFIYDNQLCRQIGSRTFELCPPVAITYDANVIAMNSFVTVLPVPGILTSEIMKEVRHA